MSRDNGQAGDDAADDSKVDRKREQVPKHDADEAREALRDLARGIRYPPLLADKGLPTALTAQARKATLPVTIEASLKEV
jgi:hypothetical protein